MSCELGQHVQAYHDGEVSSEIRARVEKHLETCAECREELAELQAMSRFLNRMERPALSDEAMARLHGSVEAVQETAIVRIAEFMTAAAAAVLLAGGLVLVLADRSEAAPAAWEQAALTLQVAPQTDIDEAQLAQWMTGEAVPVSTTDHE